MLAEQRFGTIHRVDLQVPEQVHNLKSFAELLAWAMTVWGRSEGGLLPIVRGSASRRDTTVTFKKDDLTIGTVEFGDHPSDVHAQWFLRIGMLTAYGTLGPFDRKAEKVPTHSKMAKYKSASSASDWYRGEGLGTKYFGFFCDAVGIPQEVEIYLRQRYRTFDFASRPKRFKRIAFDQDRVAGAIEASEENFVREHPRAERLKYPLTDAQEEVTAPERGNELVNDRLRVSRVGESTPRVVTLSRDGIVRLKPGHTSHSAAVLAADGSFVTIRDSDALQVIRVNRVTTQTARWSRNADLRALGEGEVLAVGAAGRCDLAFVWASPSGTHLCRTRHPGGTARSVAQLSAEPANSAVLVRGRVLLALPTSDRAFYECDAFPGLHVASLVGASANGRTVVMAIGQDIGGRACTWVELDGQTRTQIDGTDSYLQLTLGSRRTPVVVADSGQVLDLSPGEQDSSAYSRWIRPESTQTVALA